MPADPADTKDRSSKSPDRGERAACYEESRLIYAAVTLQW